jgi:hypothetical protein
LAACTAAGGVDLVALQRGHALQRGLVVVGRRRVALVQRLAGGHRIAALLQGGDGVALGQVALANLADLGEQLLFLGRFEQLADLVLQFVRRLAGGGDVGGEEVRQRRVGADRDGRGALHRGDDVAIPVRDQPLRDDGLLDQFARLVRGFIEGPRTVAGAGQRDAQGGAEGGAQATAQRRTA